MRLLFAWALLAALLLTGCAKSNTPEPAAGADSSTVPAGEITVPAAEPATDAYTAAQALVGRPVQELYDAVGQPLEAVYAPSCVGQGDDGALRYRDFTVKTYREGDSETVTFVAQS